MRRFRARMTSADLMVSATCGHMPTPASPAKTGSRLSMASWQRKAVITGMLEAWAKARRAALPVAVQLVPPVRISGRFALASNARASANAPELGAGSAILGNWAVSGAASDSSASISSGRDMTTGPGLPETAIVHPRARSSGKRAVSVISTVYLATEPNTAR